MFRVLLLVILTVSFFSADEANAWRRRRRTSYSTVAVSSTVIVGNAQSRAQAKANAMAAAGYASHHINGMGIIPNKEGIGCGSSRYCGTCTYSGTLIADAAAYSSRTKLWYRVRVWR
jgi:hypothetical protein